MNAAADLYLVISAIRSKGKIFPYYDSAEFHNGIEEAARLADLCRFSEESEVFRRIKKRCCESPGPCGYAPLPLSANLT